MKKSKTKLARALSILLHNPNDVPEWITEFIRYTLPKTRENDDPKYSVNHVSDLSLYVLILFSLKPLSSHGTEYQPGTASL